MILGYSPAVEDMIAHPIAMAAWFGLLATCLNLFPIWQLDGGHMAYAVSGSPLPEEALHRRRRSRWFSISFVGWPFPAYLVFGMLLLILGSRFRFYHPPTLYDEESVGTGRVLVCYSGASDSDCFLHPGSLLGFRIEAECSVPVAASGDGSY